MFSHAQHRNSAMPHEPCQPKLARLPKSRARPQTPSRQSAAGASSLSAIAATAGSGAACNGGGMAAAAGGTAAVAGRSSRTGWVECSNPRRPSSMLPVGLISGDWKRRPRDLGDSQPLLLLPTSPAVLSSTFHAAVTALCTTTFVSSPDIHSFLKTSTLER